MDLNVTIFLIVTALAGRAAGDRRQLPAERKVILSIVILLNVLIRFAVPGVWRQVRGLPQGLVRLLVEPVGLDRMSTCGLRTKMYNMAHLQACRIRAIKKPRMTPTV